MPLYGHELNEEINPFEAGLGFACHLAGYDFPGRDALLRIQQGAAAAGARRPGAGRPADRRGKAPDAAHDGQPVGAVTSGTFSPTLQKPIAMGYVRPELAEPGTELAVDVRGRPEPGRVVELPFYRRSIQGSRDSMTFDPKKLRCTPRPTNGSAWRPTRRGADRHRGAYRLRASRP